MIFLVFEKNILKTKSKNNLKKLGIYFSTGSEARQILIELPQNAPIFYTKNKKRYDGKFWKKMFQILQGAKYYKGIKKKNVDFLFSYNTLAMSSQS